jgi:hypothetical protein
MMTWAKGNRIWLTLAAVAVSMAAFMALSAEPVVAQRDFCSALKAVMNDTPNRYMSFKSGRFDKKKQQWGAKTMLPGMQRCRIDVELNNFQCENFDLSHSRMEQQATKLVDAIQSCLPGVTPQIETQERDDYVRTITQWQTPEKQQVEVVTRRYSRENNRDQIFVYVEEAEEPSK